MSEFLGEARVVIVPDTKGFATALRAQLAAATKGVTVPVNVVASTAGSTGALTALTGVQKASNDEQRKGIEIAKETAKRERELAAAAAARARQLKQVNTAAIAGAAGMVGLRGAVLTAGGAFIATTVALQAFFKSVSAFAEFEAQLGTFAAITESTAEQMEEVSARAQQLGADIRLPGVSALDAANSMTELAKAGLTVEEAMAGVEGTLQLATAAQISQAEAAEITANALNSFQLAGADAARVADVLANAANSAQGSILDFGFAFRQSSAVANQVGLPLENTAALLSIFAKNGLQGSDAGTALRTALIRLINPTDKAKEKIEELGFSIRDAQGNIRADVFGRFGKSVEDLEPAARDAAAALIFGQDAIRAVAIGAREGSEAVRLMRFEMDQQGTAAEVAAARTQGLAGSLGALQSGAETLSVNFGRLASKGVGPIVDLLADAVSTMNRAADAAQDLGQKARESEGPVRNLANAVLDFAVANTPGVGEARFLAGAIDELGGSADEQADKLAQLRKELDLLQTARIQAQTGDPGGEVAKRFTERINLLRNEIAALEGAGSAIQAGVTTPLEKALATAEKAQRIEINVEGNADPVLARMIARLREMVEAARLNSGNIQRLRDDFLNLGSAGDESSRGVDRLAASLRRLRGEASALSDELLRAQNANVGPQTEIGLLQQAEQNQRDIIEGLRAGGIEAGEPSQIRDARKEIERIQGQIESLQQGIVSDQKAAAASAKTAATEAQKARDEQFEAIADMFGGRQGNIENAIERAGIEGNVQAVIRLNKALIASLQKERAALLERLRTLKVSNEVRKKILDAIDAAIDDAKNDILRAQIEQAKNIKDFATPAIDLRIRIAQAQDNTAAELAARRAKLAAITKELVKLKNAGKKNTLAWLELKAQQAEEARAIRELNNQDKDDGKSPRKQAAEFFFEQLQDQKGFASNLLGNLIPAGQTAGLVGVPSPTAGPGSGISLAANLQESKAGGGPTSGQASTTNDLLVRILQQLKNLNGEQDHPEATHQRRVGHGSMDNVAM